MADSNLSKLGNLEAIELWHERASGLCARLQMAISESGVSLRNQPNIVQEGYAWACNDLAEAVCERAKAL